MAPKKSVTEEVFNAFKGEVERNSRYLVDQLLQRINEIEEKYANMEDENNRKIEKIEEKCKQIENQHKIEVKKMNEKHDKHLQNLEQSDNLQNLRRMFGDQKLNTNVMNNDQKNSNIEISKPLFYANNKDQHPIDFLQSLEEYFKVKQMNKEERLIIIRDCLKGSASNWYSTIKFQIRDYADFRNAFIDEFWSR